MTHPLQDKELLAWAAAKIAEAQRSGTYGSMTFYLEGGRIIRSELKEMDKPGGEQVATLTGRTARA